jgi:tetratricopeptide (TPR) repeat protein
MWDERSSGNRIGQLLASAVLATAMSAAVYGQDPSGRPTDPKGKKPPTTGKRPVTTTPETRPTVILTVLSDPPGSAVFVNGESRGATNAEGRLVLDKIALGHYTVEVRKDGFASMVRGFEAGADQPTLVFKLEARFDDVNKEFDSLVQDGKLVGPETPNAFELVGRLAKKYPDRPEIARMRAVLSGKLIERLGPVIERTIKAWRAVTREELTGAQDWAVLALTLKRDDRRLQAQGAYLNAVVALREWQTGESQSGAVNAEGGADHPGNPLRLSAARAELEKAVAFDDSWASSWYQMGVVRLYGMDLSGAEAAFNKVAQLEPKWAIAQAGLGSTYYAEAKYKDAIDAYKKAIDLDKNCASAHAGLGLARTARGEKDGVKDIKKAIEIDAQSGVPQLYLGMAYAKSKKKDDLARAVEALKSAIQKNANNLEFQNRTAEQLIADLQKKK